MDYSVLMSVYRKETAANLRASMESIRNQTVSTNDFVLVCDGPLTPELDAVIADMGDVFGDVLNVIRIPQNGGLGPALNLGLRACRNELVARMDSDDISYPDRCSRQLKIFSDHPEIDICSGTLEEFSDSPDWIDVRRTLPEHHREIYEFAKSRCPFNHPCVMYRKEAVVSAGGYISFVLEDYYLWIRMLLNGSRGYNIPEPVLWMRAGNDMYRRRSGWKYGKDSCKLFLYMKRQGMIGSASFVKSCVLRLGSALAPNWLRRFFYKKLLRQAD